MDIKNIIFDFGGVLLNLDLSKTAAAFTALMGGTADRDKAYQSLIKQNIFTDYETGKISTDTFVTAIQTSSPYPLAPEQIKAAWLAMLLDFPPQRLQLLQELKAKGYQLYLLSNINELHLSAVRLIMQNELNLFDFDSLFKGVFYSHLIQQRKPNVSTYQYLIQKTGIAANQSVFIDDMAENLVGARTAGLHTIHHQANSNINQRLKNYLML